MRAAGARAGEIELTLVPLSTLAGGTSPSLIEQVVSAAERITGKRVRRGKETNAILLSLPQAGWAVTEKLTLILIKNGE
ncbi:hypothetical protein LZK75_15210 [Rhizobium leguminosarum]|nr:hypothetical protein LZK75_15210 [Rhizobium leguminosarum]